MNVYALQTARMGSKSVLNKNTLKIKGKPLWLYNAENTIACNSINKTWISTDIPEIIKKWPWVIKRPENLCGDKASHYDTILHGLNYIEAFHKQTVDVLVILLGNNNGADAFDIEMSIDMLRNDPKASSVMSVGKYNMFNPFRAYKKTNKYANTYVDQKVTKNSTKSNHNDKNAYGDVYFFNGSFWICRREAIIKNNGLLPFPWLGKNILMYEQNPQIMEVDAEWQLALL